MMVPDYESNRVRHAAVDFRDHAHNLIDNALEDHPELIRVCVLLNVM